MIGLIQKLLMNNSKTQTYDQTLELEDIQGIVLCSYSHLAHSSYIFLQVSNSKMAKQWLGNILQHGQITSAQPWPKDEKGKSIRPEAAVNIGLTHAGIQVLSESETLSHSFPLEFRQGMQHPERSRRIGDYEGTINHPSQWETYWQNDAVHLVILLQASSKEEKDQLKQALDLLNSGLTVLAIEQGYLQTNPRDNREHFGFRDGISQPTVEGSPQMQKTLEYDSQITKAGEFVLGYLNEDGNFPQTPFVSISDDLTNCLPPLREHDKRDFGRNGSYLVYRKMEQDVAGFRRYFKEAFETPADGQKMAAKVIGRWPSGASLVEFPNQDPGEQGDIIRNDFGYRDRDPQGSRCPFAAHVRRLNPRDSLGDNAIDAQKAAQRRRILRRGTLYGDPLPDGQLEPDGQARGLHFFCFNANIRRQFEFIQQSWVNNPKFHGLYEERDPLIGMNPDESNRSMTVMDQTGAKRLSLPNFVTVKGGAYFFVPSLSALQFLSRR